ncbi:hypothetical protein HDV04_000633 [Boothiomyces sp. JEL0838]|nr:hypothetical protein HDV04_000633 [Boothiomyces sp. JEL0838]
MHLKLDGKLVLVTGSTAGIGKEIAKTLLAENANVIINGRSQSKVDQVVEELKAGSSGNVYGIAADISTLQGVESLVQKVQAIGPLYALVNNTGIFESKPFQDISPEEWLQMFNTNVMSGVSLSKPFIKQFLERNEGTILFVSSEAAYASKGFMVHYSMTKAAQLAVARGLAETTKGTNVRVNSILPGPTWTDGVEEYIRGIAKQSGKSVDAAIKDYFATHEPSSLIQRFETPKEIADIAVFMVSPIASAVNGRSWLADGGIIRNL